MDFRRWALNERGLSESSTSKYYSALEGPLSKWAIESGASDTPLLEIGNSTQFEQIASKIQSLDDFKETNDRGNGMYGAALNRFLDFLTSKQEDQQLISSDNIPRLEDVSQKNAAHDSAFSIADVDSILESSAKQLNIIQDITQQNGNESNSKSKSINSLLDAILELQKSAEKTGVKEFVQTTYLLEKYIQNVYSDSPL